MTIEQMQRKINTLIPALNEIFDQFCGTMQANANLCFMHMLTITFPALGLHEWYLSHISLNDDA